MIELAVVIIAVAFVVLVGYLIPTVIRLRQMAIQTERLLSQLNRDLPPLLQGLKDTSENVTAITNQAKQGVDQVSGLLNAIGEVGQTVTQIHGSVRGKSSAILMSLASVLSGIMAASSTIKSRVYKEGGKRDDK